MIVHTVLHKSVTDLLTGSGNEGRWCSGGRKVIYTSSSIALACLENILRMNGSGFSMNFQTVFYEIPADIIIDEILQEDLQAGWRLRGNYEYCQQIGHDWHDKKDALVLKIPSSVIPDEFNYVIKSTGKDIKRIRILETRRFVPDERLDAIMKRL